MQPEWRGFNTGRAWKMAKGVTGKNDREKSGTLYARLVVTVSMRAAGH